MRTSNPALNDEVFQVGASYDRTMTVPGTAIKTGVLLGVLVFAASVSWTNPTPLVVFGGGIAGLILAIITVFSPRSSPFTAPMYAFAEGLLLGGVSQMVNTRFPGIAFQAMALTCGTLASLLIAYMAGIVRATEKFKLGVCAATGAIFLVYLVGFVLSFFGAGIPYIHGTGPIGIGFSLIVVVIAALNLVLDFDFIENGARNGAPKYMEWYGAFGLLVTLVWLYIEILRLLSKLRSND